MILEEDSDWNHPTVVVLGPEYGSRAGTKIHVRAVRYTLCGPVVFFPGTFGCEHDLAATSSVTGASNDSASEVEEITVDTTLLTMGVGVQPNQ